MKKIAIFASGSGTNAQKIMEHFSESDQVEVAMVLVNKSNAGVIERAQNFNVPITVFNKQQFSQSDEIVTLLKQNEIDLVVLAGFLWLIPQNMVNSYPNKIVNIHPALLPKYGGKGMYGSKVHEAVILAKEVESGITIHYVNEKYDEGAIIAQFHCEVTPEDTSETLAQRIHSLEHAYFPEVIEHILSE